jgi:Ca-activated chloride channel family protein
MVDLATYGKGNSYYIKNSVDIPEIFSNELSRIRILAAQETKIKVKFPSEYLSVKNVFGYHYQVNGDEVVIDLKDIFSGQKKSILIKFNVDKRFGSKQTLECFLTYNDVKNEIKNIEEKVFVYITPVKTISEYETGVNVPVTQYIVKQEANDIMEQALYDVENGNYQNAREKVKKGKEYMKEQMNTLPQSGDMDEQYNNLDKYGQDLDNIETKTDDDKKGIQKDNKYKNYGTRNK